MTPTSVPRALLATLAADTFSHLHIGVTALITAVIAGGVAIWRLAGPRRALEGVALAAITGVAVYLFRASANMPQLNNDGIAGYSANDWLAPVIVFVALSIYADLRPPANPRRYHEVRAAATLAAFAVNVITI